MRIIAGKYKGKKLVSPKDDKIRPTADKVKEAIFSMLAMEISGKNILDLFGGTGALGLEAISRGAENVCIVDSSPRATAIIYQNINNVLDNVDAKRVEVIKSSFEVGVAKQAGRSFDIIFIDPPYKKGLYEEVLVSLAKSEILTPETILILESGSGNKDYSIIDVYEVLKEKRYGNTLVRVLGYNLDFITFSPEKDELLSENSEYE